MVPAAQQFSEGQKPQENLAKPAKSNVVNNTQTFAPDSAFKDVKQVIKPEKGTVIEVVVAWGERVIATHHFSTASTVDIGTDPSCDIILPLVGTPLRKHKFIKIDSLAHVFISKEMSGEYVTSSNTGKVF